MRFAKLLLALSLSLFPPSVIAEKLAVINFASDTQWKVTRVFPTASGTGGKRVLGNAQRVCLSGWSPLNCPENALDYGHGDGWSADLTPIPGAYWIWAPDYQPD